MGGSNAQSAEGESQTKSTKKVCYYELLGVERNCTEKELVKAFRKASLRWHPDKNKEEDTTEKFQEINEAYQCLNDPQSRSWYDQHREQILKGKDPDNMQEADEDYITKSKLKPFFKDSCHEGFDPEKENNFFNVYDQLFRRLDNEEEMEEEVGTKHFYSPLFGLHNAKAEEVFAFYDSWKFFTTAKKFAYADLYNPNEAPNRRIKRIIEMENKKERQKERVKFNELVRELVEKLREKDPRYRKFIVQVQQEKEAKRRKLEEERNAKKEAEAERLRIFREERAAMYAKQEAEAMAKGEYEEVFVEEFHCQICKKVFKKEAQLDNHLKSKKHKDAEAKYKEKYQLDSETEDQLAQEEANRKQQEELVEEEADGSSENEEEPKKK